jgi:hypothetical protein
MLGPPGVEKAVLVGGAGRHPTEEISERMIAELRLRDARAWWW